MTDDGLHPEDAKLVTLARAARGRVAAREGAAVRDETGRTTSAATVDLPGLVVPALVLAVASAAAAGARSLEAAVLITPDGDIGDDALAAVRAVGGGGVPVIVASLAGTVVAQVTS